MTPAPIQYDTLEKRFRDLQLRYTRSKKYIIYIGLIVVSLFVIMLLGFLIKGPKNFAVDFELFGPQNPLYVVDTPQCRIFNYEPFNNDVTLYKAQMNYSVADRPGSCGSLPLLSSVSRNASGHTLHLHKEYFINYSASAENTTCCYSYVFSSALLFGEEENATVDEPKYMYCKEFDGDVKLETDFDFVRVTCGKNVAKENPGADPPSDVYRHFHSYVSLKREVRVKMDLYNETIRLGKKFENDSEVAPWEKPWSVMIIGLDSVSRLNLMRMMPKTVDYLEKSGWYGLEGYSKVGDNTFPNLAAAVLAGSTEEQLRKTCVPNDDTPVDWCPWIWSHYASQGYVTAYGEDSTDSDTFYVRAGGFRHPPTDFFLRTLLKAANDYAHPYWFEKFVQYHDCVGKSHESEYIFDFSLEFAEVLNFYPKFALFWLNSFSHDRLYGPKTMDVYLRSYFQNLTAILNDTIVVFMSDHGMAHGFYRHTEMGYFETNLPFIYFWLPESFQQLNPKAVENLVANKHRLTSHFDLHMTLLDLLGDPSDAPGCHKCRSLFQPVPLNRTCDDAGIPLRYCACSQYTNEANTSYEYLAEFLVNEINTKVEPFQKYSFPEFRCANFSLKKINFIKRVIPNVNKTQWKSPSPNKNAANETPPEDIFVVSIETAPKALFEAMIWKYEDDSMRIIDTVLRIDSYDVESRCLNNGAGKPYCVCEAKIDILKMIMDDEKAIDAQLNLSTSGPSPVNPVESIIV